MKRIKILIAAIVITASAVSVSSCKKGENDPFISLKSRDKRLEGSWKLTGIDGKSTTISVFGSTRNESVTTTTYSGGVQTITTSGGGSGTQTKYDYEVTIDKDGTWKSVAKYYNTAGTLQSTIEGDGTWLWANDGKNKSSIIVSDPQNTLISGILEVDMLKNKKLALKGESRTKSSSASSSTENIKSTTYTFEAI